MAKRGDQGAQQLAAALFQNQHGGIVYSLRCRRSIDVRREFSEECRYDANHTMVEGVHREVREALRDTPLPRYIWVVEFTTYELFTKPVMRDRHLLGELYFDATAANALEPTTLLFAHFMGLWWARTEVCSGSPVPVGPKPIPGDQPYFRYGIPLWSETV